MQTNANRISRQIRIHAFRAGPKWGLPYVTGHPETAKRNILYVTEPFQCNPVIFTLKEK